MRLFVAIIFVAVLSLPSMAQSTAGRTLGTVSDQSGAAVAGATVIVTDAERGTSRVLTTDDAGAYVAADLLKASEILVRQPYHYRRNTVKEIHFFDPPFVKKVMVARHP